MSEKNEHFLKFGAHPRMMAFEETEKFQRFYGCNIWNFCVVKNTTSALESSTGL